MKKILILLPGPFLKRDYERFGIDTLKKNFLVKAIDCTSWTHPELWKEYSKIVFKCKEHVVISCKRDFLTLLSQINPAIVIDELHGDKKTNWMRQQIKKNPLRKAFFSENVIISGSRLEIQLFNTLYFTINNFLWTFSFRKTKFFKK